MLATKFKPRTTTVVIAKAASTSRLDLCVTDTQGGDPTGILPRLSDVLVEGYGGPDRQRYRKGLPAMGLQGWINAFLMTLFELSFSQSTRVEVACTPFTASA